MLKITNYYLIFILSIFLINPLHGQIHDFDSLVTNNDSFKKIAAAIGDTLDLFNNDETLIVTLETDFKNLRKGKYKEEYQDAIFRMMYNDTVQITRNITIRARGIMRKRICHIPPIKLNFSKKDAFIKQLEDFDKLKIVLDCKSGNIYEQYLLSEYYAYKIQNIITNYSLRARLLKAKYIDTSGKSKDITRYAFILEDIDQLAARHNAMRIETKSIRDNQTNLPVLMDSYLFQYLIGNTDWSILAMHNIYLLKSLNPLDPNPYVIPYDFDYAGIVDTNYAVPDEQLGTKSVRERVYRGYCLPIELVKNSAKKFIQNKEKIYAIYQNETLLNKSTKGKTIRYLDEFYEIIENENLLKRHIIESCR